VAKSADPDELAADLAPFAHAFNLDGPGPRFLQDFDELPGEPDSPETQLIEAPGEQTRRRNLDLLVKAGRVTQLSRAAAAIALFTLQCYAPSGGRGNLTSVRGGGPLTTLVLPGGEPLTLWQLIWANVPNGRTPTADQLPRVFPWLAATRTADRFPTTTEKEAHRLQAFWGMPRRIRLDFADNSEGLPCNLTESVDPVIVTGWRQRPNDVKYVAWDHPLTPSYKDAKTGGWLPVHAQPSGIGYRDWVGIAVSDAEGKRRPAQCVADWPDRAADLPELGETRLFAAGYDTDNMKARGFVEAELPLPGSNPQTAKAIARVGRRLVQSAEIVVQSLRRAVRDALFTRDTKIDSTPLATVYEGFWAATQDRFFDLLRSTEGDWEAALTTHAPGWRAVLQQAALALFDQAAPLDPTVVSFDPKRIVDAKRNLFFVLQGYGPTGKQLFEILQLTLPDANTTRQRKGNMK
jgi:CRISPR system Cascade subunit CasA